LRAWKSSGSLGSFWSARAFDTPAHIISTVNTAADRKSLKPWIESVKARENCIG
jgi:hypothetical protein